MPKRQSTKERHKALHQEFDKLYNQKDDSGIRKYTYRYCLMRAAKKTHYSFSTALRLINTAIDE